MLAFRLRCSRPIALGASGADVGVGGVAVGVYELMEDVMGCDGDGL